MTAIEHHRVKYVVPTSILVKGNEISHAKDLVEADCISDFSNEIINHRHCGVLIFKTLW